MALVNELSEILRVGIDAAGFGIWPGAVPLEHPAEDQRGDYATAVSFELAKQNKVSPAAVAQKIASYLNANLNTLEIKDLDRKEGWRKAAGIIERFEPAGPFINIWLTQEYLISRALTALKQGAKYGRLKSVPGSGPTIVEYSSINVGKPMGIGHLRSTVIGDTIANLLEATGHKVVRINYLGDWGTQFGKLIVAYKKWGNEQAFKKTPTLEMLRVYVKFNNELKKDLKLIEEARRWFKKLEQDDKEALALWKKFRKATLTAAQKIYDLLGIKFDEITGESKYRGKLQENLIILRDKKLLKKSQGALIVDLSAQDLPPLIMQKKDASSIYASRELAAARARYKKYKFSQMLYEVGSEQELHFRQIFSVLNLLGYPWAKNLEHIKHGLYSMAGQRMSTRAGRFSGMEELLTEAIKKAETTIKEKNPTLKNRAKVARQVGVGAVKYNDLSQSRLTNISFDFDRMLSLEGNSAPYLQYTYARIQSILRKAAPDDAKKILAEATKKNLKLAYQSDSEKLLLRRLIRYPEVLFEAAHKRQPHLLATELFALASLFNLFYAKDPILKAQALQKKSRLVLITAVGVILKNGLEIMGIETPLRM